MSHRLVIAFVFLGGFRLLYLDQYASIGQHSPNPGARAGARRNDLSVILWLPIKRPLAAGTTEIIRGTSILAGKARRGNLDGHAAGLACLAQRAVRANDSLVSEPSHNDTPNGKLHGLLVVAVV